MTHGHADHYLGIGTLLERFPGARALATPGVVEYIKDTLCVRMGGRCAEQIVFGTLTTGASNDLQGSTEMAKRMVREFGMSDRIGPMAWGSQGMV